MARSTFYIALFLFSFLPPCWGRRSSFSTEKRFDSYVAFTMHNPKNTPVNSHHALCTGSLIGKRWILTAGHCNNTKGDVVGLGKGLEQFNGKFRNGFYRVRKVHLAPGYRAIYNIHDPTNIVGYNRDVALLELETEVENAQDKVVTLNTDCDNPDEGTDVFSAGDGKDCIDDEVERKSSRIRIDAMKAIGSATCGEMFKKAGMKLAGMDIRSKALGCTLGSECRRRLCNGGSGGAVVTRKRREMRQKDDTGSEDGRGNDTPPVQIGVDSWKGVECGKEKLPNVFEPVVAYVGWIYNTTNGDVKLSSPKTEISFNDSLCSTYFKMICDWRSGCPCAAKTCNKCQDSKCPYYWYTKCTLDDCKKCRLCPDKLYKIELGIGSGVCCNKDVN